MAWIKRTKKKNGTVSFWVHDDRDGRQITIAECHSEPEALLQKEQYEIRRDLEKEGYDDKYASEQRPLLARVSGSFPRRGNS